MTTEPRIDYVVFGTIEAIEAEYGLPDMGADWYIENEFTHAVKIIGDAGWDVEFATSAKESRDCGRGIAKELGVRVSAI